MSSSISLVPTASRGKKKRPTFRPAASRKKSKTAPSSLTVGTRKPPSTSSLKKKSNNPIEETNNADLNATSRIADGHNEKKSECSITTEPSTASTASTTTGTSALDLTTNSDPESSSFHQESLSTKNDDQNNSTKAVGDTDTSIQSQRLETEQLSAENIEGGKTPATTESTTTNDDTTPSSDKQPPPPPAAAAAAFPSISQRSKVTKPAAPKRKVAAGRSIRVRSSANSNKRQRTSSGEQVVAQKELARDKLEINNNSNNAGAQQQRQLAVALVPKKKGGMAEPAVPSLASFCSKYKKGKGKRGGRTKEKDKNTAKPPAATATPEANQQSNARGQEEEEIVEDENSNRASAGPQVQIIDGEIVLNASSMMVPNQRKTVAEVEEEYQSVVEEEGHTSVVGASYSSFTKRRKPHHWTVADTKKFYDALRQVGADFSCMEAYFDNKRTRKQLKKKYQKESIRNPHLIELALSPKARVSIDLDVFKVNKDDVEKTKEESAQREKEAAEAAAAAAEKAKEDETNKENEADAAEEDVSLRTDEQQDNNGTSQESEFGGDGLFDRSRNFDSLFDDEGPPVDQEQSLYAQDEDVDEFQMADIDTVEVPPTTIPPVHEETAPAEGEEAKAGEPAPPAPPKKQQRQEPVTLSLAPVKKAKAKPKRKFKVLKGRKK